MVTANLALRFVLELAALFIAPKARFHVSKPVWYGLQVVIFGAAVLALASVWTPVAGIALALIVVANTTLLAFAGERR
jgi:hypothetical protein